MLLILSTVALIIIGILVIAPYQKSSKFIETTCVPLHTEYGRTERHCSCGRGCNSQFPCVAITVEVVSRVDIDAARTWTTRLSDDDSLLHKQVKFVSDNL